MKVFGGFEHNLHALRIAEVLEYPYPDFPGLNLSSEVLEAMAHHSKRRDVAEIADFIIVGQPLLEARVVDAADSLAYNAHDIDDALGLELITPHDLNEVPFWRAVRASPRAARRAAFRTIAAYDGSHAGQLASRRFTEALTSSTSAASNCQP